MAHLDRLKNKNKLVESTCITSVREDDRRVASTRRPHVRVWGGACSLGKIGKNLEKNLEKSFLEVCAKRFEFSLANISIFALISLVLGENATFG